MKTKSKILFFLTLLLLSIPTGYGQQDINKVIEKFKNYNANRTKFIVSSHRGFWHEAAENSKLAYDKAIEIGTDMVEIDVRLTSDKIPVVFHDGCLNRVTNKKGVISSYTWAELQGTKLKNYQGFLTNQELLSLEQAFVHLKNKALINLDIKGKGKEYEFILKEAIRLAKKHQILRQLVVKGPLQLEELEKILTDAGTSLQDIFYTPVVHENATEKYFTDYLNNTNIYGMELIFKQQSSPMLKPGGFVERARNNNKWVGTYSFWPESTKGVEAEVIVKQTNPNNPPERITVSCDDVPVYWSYDYKNSGNLNDFFDDARGNWEFLSTNNANYVITDRPQALISYFKSIGKAQ